MNKLVAHISEVDDVDDCLTFCLLMLAVRERGKNVPLLVDSHLMNSLGVVSKLAIFKRSVAIDAFGLRPNDLVPYVPGRQARWFPKTS